MTSYTQNPDGMFHFMTTPDFILMIITYAVLFSILAYIAWEYFKLNQFRQNVRPDDVVNFKSQYDVAFKVVKSRPGKYVVLLSDMDDETKIFRVSINKIYPL